MIYSNLKNKIFTKSPFILILGGHSMALDYLAAQIIILCK